MGKFFNVTVKPTIAAGIQNTQFGNNDVLFDIDWQGTQQLSKYKELKLLKIYILPPDKKELAKRLEGRNQDKKDVVEKRLKSFENDITHWHDYDYIVINDNLESCFQQIEKIILNSQKKINLN